MRNRQLRTTVVMSVFAISTIALHLCAAEPLQNPGRHPFVATIDKDAYNAWAELQSALSSGASEDACRIVTSLNENALRGLLPDSGDRDLFASFPVMIEQIVQSEPTFVKTMIDKFESQGTIRVRSAIERRDDRALRMAIWQFAGTDAAREAHLWFGDASLALGRFREAEYHFQTALTNASLARRESLAPRLTLARALGDRLSEEQLGNEEQPNGQTLAFNGTKVTRAEFDTLIKNSVRSWTPEKRIAEGLPIASPAFPVGDYALTKHVELSLRDLAVTRPHLSGEQIVVSRTNNSTKELVCLNLSDGKIAWTSQPVVNLLSDPLSWNQSLAVATLTKQENEQFSINEAWIDRVSGHVQATRPLFQLRDTIASAELAANDWNAILAVNGMICCFTADREMRWVRRFRPSTASTNQSFRHRSIGITTPGNVILATYGPNEITCFDLITGRERWRQQAPEMTGLLEVTETRVLFQTAAGIMSLDSQTGQTVCQFRGNLPIESTCEDGTNLVIRSSDHKPQRSMRTLIWLDLKTGNEIGQRTLEGPLLEQSKWGPLFHGAGSWWTILDRPKENSVLYRIVTKD